MSPRLEEGAVARPAPPQIRRQRRTATAAGLVLPVLAAVAVLGFVALTPPATRLGDSIDLEIFRRYMGDLLAGKALYREVPVEYPPLAVVPMLVPLVLPPPAAPADLEPVAYLWRFAIVEASVAILAGWIVMRAAPQQTLETAMRWAILAVLSWVAIALRFDSWPVAASAAALLLAVRGWAGAAGVAIGVGGMLKLYPVALLPILVSRELARGDRRAAGRLVGGVVAVLSIVSAAAWLAGGAASLDWLRYQGDRGLQIESVGASLLMGLHLMDGQPLEPGFAFGSVELRAAGAATVAALAPLLEIVFVGIAIVVSARRFRADVTAMDDVPVSSLALASTAMLAGLLLGSKVLSFQYALWRAPFVVLLPDRRLAWLGVAITGLSTWIFTWDYVGLWHFQTGMVLALLARNVLLAGLWLGTTLSLLGRRPSIAPRITVPGRPGRGFGRPGRPAR